MRIYLMFRNVKGTLLRKPILVFLKKEVSQIGILEAIGSSNE